MVHCAIAIDDKRASVRWGPTVPVAIDLLSAIFRIDHDDYICTYYVNVFLGKKLHRNSIYI